MGKTKRSTKKKKPAAKQTSGIIISKVKGSNAVGGNAGGNTSNQTKVKPVKQKAALKPK